jgi:hypothetical protein
MVGIIKLEHRRLESSRGDVPHYDAPLHHVRRFKRIDEEGPVRHDGPHILEAGQEQPTKLCFVVNRVLGTRTEDRIERGEVKAGRQGSLLDMVASSSLLFSTSAESCQNGLANWLWKPSAMTIVRPSSQGFGTAKHNTPRHACPRTARGSRTCPLEAVAVRRGRVAGLLRRLQLGVLQSIVQAPITIMQRNVAAAVLRITALVRVGAAEIGQHTAIAPALRTLFFSAVEIERDAANPNHPVDRGRTNHPAPCRAAWRAVRRTVTGFAPSLEASDPK